MTIAPRFVTALCVVLAAALPAQGKIKWETDFDAALERAKKENKLIVACVSMKGERVCDVIVDEHYCDSKILKLSKNTVNLFCSPHGTAAQKTMEQRLRTQLLKKSADDWIVAPQHVIFSPDGKLLSSVPYFLSVGELEWLWAEALKKHDLLMPSGAASELTEVVIDAVERADFEHTHPDECSHDGYPT